GIWYRRRAFRGAFAMMKGDYFVAIMVIGFLLALYYQHNNPAQPVKNIQLSTGTQPPRNIYVQPQLSPNGSAWPKIPSYIDGYPISANQGLSDVTGFVAQTRVMQEVLSLIRVS
ncbi:MAG: hypothetical protein ACKOEV_15395, partial [Cytophagales bacterium]